jgi:hypothetical protein
MISASLNYLRESDDVVVTTAIGGLLFILSVFLIPVFFVSGYLMRVLRQTANGNDEPPVFDDWGDLGVDGLKAVAISVVYSVIPLTVLGIVGALTVGLAVAGLGDGAAGGLVGGTLALLLVALGFALSIVGAYVTPAALSNFADTGRLTAGFELRTLWTVLTTKAYAVGWLTAMAVVLGGAIVVSILSIVPIIGTLVGLFVQFYALVAACYIFGHTWSTVRPIATERIESNTVERPAV